MGKLLGNKRGFSIEAVPQVAIILVMLAVILGISSTVISAIQSSQCTSPYRYDESKGKCYTTADGENFTVEYGSAAFNATSQGQTAIATLSNWQNTWAVIIAAAIVIGIIGTYLFFRYK